MQPMQSTTALAHDDPYMRMTPAQRVAEVRMRRIRLNTPPARPAPCARIIQSGRIAPPIPNAMMIEALDLIEKNARPRLSVENIQLAVAALFPPITLSDIKSPRRTANIVLPRQLAMYMVKILTVRSLPEIGRLFGGRDHTTVLHAVRKMEALKDKDLKLASQIEQISAMFASEAV